MKAIDTLNEFGISKAGAEILRYFLVRPTAAPHTRELQRVLGLGGRSLQRELQRLVVLGALERVRDDRMVRHRAVTSSPVWRAVQQLAGASTDPAPLLRTALADVEGIEAAFLFGSMARGIRVERASDIDVFIVEGPELDCTKLFRHLSEIALLLEREVNAVRYTRAALADRVEDRTHPAHAFVQHALTRPKRWLVGTPSAMRRPGRRPERSASGRG